MKKYNKNKIAENKIRVKEGKDYMILKDIIREIEDEFLSDSEAVESYLMKEKINVAEAKSNIQKMMSGISKLEQGKERQNWYNRIRYRIEGMIYDIDISEFAVQYRNLNNEFDKDAEGIERDKKLLKAMEQIKTNNE